MLITLRNSASCCTLQILNLAWWHFYAHRWYQTQLYDSMRTANSEWVCMSNVITALACKQPEISMVLNLEALLGAFKKGMLNCWAICNALGQIKRGYLLDWKPYLQSTGSVRRKEACLCKCPEPEWSADLSIGDRPFSRPLACACKCPPAEHRCRCISSPLLSHLIHTPRTYERNWDQYWCSYFVEWNLHLSALKPMDTLACYQCLLTKLF